MKNEKKKADKRTVMVRAVCIFLAGLMVLGVLTYAIMVLMS